MLQTHAVLQLSIVLKGREEGRPYVITACIFFSFIGQHVLLVQFNCSVGQKNTFQPTSHWALWLFGETKWFWFLYMCVFTVCHYYPAERVANVVYFRPSSLQWSHTAQNVITGHFWFLQNIVSFFLPFSSTKTLFVFPGRTLCKIVWTLMIILCNCLKTLTFLWKGKYSEILKFRKFLICYLLLFAQLLQFIVESY